MDVDGGHAVVVVEHRRVPEQHHSPRQRTVSYTKEHAEYLGLTGTCPEEKVKVKVKVKVSGLLSVDVVLYSETKVTHQIYKKQNMLPK